MNPPLCFLHLPTEVRSLVYRHLFSELSVTVARASAVGPSFAPAEAATMNRSRSSTSWPPSA
ncbi:hypothetical protein GJ744_001891 [Endocarpon pusillum]|uniref:Uncharacterized protein n=1 Tax=Endocarpon pusillum TaxID=364733 RepID=A0A8H7E8N6_9EURO|nr:hypothetical protein GJ744_001891 [Endocarpon pusillum]